MAKPCGIPAPRQEGGRTSIPPADELFTRFPELCIPQDDYNINVTVGYGEKLASKEALDAFDIYRQNGAPVHVYFHIPLCKYVCHFCNYVKKRAAGTPEEKSFWTELLLTEAEAYLEHAAWITGARVESVYFGGGTATTLGINNLEKLLSLVRGRCQLAPNCEISLEGNPDDFTPGFAKAATEIGFNRFSVGIQSLDAKVNKFAGRGHTPEMSLQAIEELLEAKVPFNADIIFGLPRQSTESSCEDIDQLVRLGVPTITIYRFRNADRQSLGIGNVSVWNRPEVKQKLHAVGAFLTIEEAYEIRRTLVRRLSDAGYRASPCGWWSRPNTYPAGNIPQVSKNKWQNHDTMIGFGPGAYGWLSADPTAQFQTHNQSNIDEYLKERQAGRKRPLAFARRLDSTQSIVSDLGFAFKARQPIPVQRYRDRYGIALMEDAPYNGIVLKLLRAGFVDYDPQIESLYPTDLGEFLHEEIISKYILSAAQCAQAHVCNR